MDPVQTALGLLSGRLDAAALPQELAVKPSGISSVSPQP
jgi:hypothetical protein